MIDSAHLKEVMREKYSMKDLGIKALIGRKILSALINEECDLVVLETDKGMLYLSWEGDCCAKCYLANVTGADVLKDAVILSAENAEWQDVNRNERDFEVTESMGTNIKTSRGYVSFESRLEHNGFYSGEIKVSDDEPMDSYSSPRYSDCKEWPKLKPLIDF